MSWSEHLTNILASNNKGAAIIGLDGRTWAKVGLDRFTEEEAKGIVAYFQQQDPRERLVLDGKRFLTVACRDDFYYGRECCVAVAIAKSQIAFIIGIHLVEYPEPATVGVVKTAEYLASLGY